MNWCGTSSIWVLLLCSLFQTARTCWGPGSLEYGDTTPDFNLLVGSELVVDCKLKSARLPKINIPVNSSYLVFKKDNDNQLLSSYVHEIDSLTAQLRIPKAEVDDSGFYHCQMILPDESKHLVCSTNVCVGYPPKNVSNFKCISENFDNLTCTWDIEPNNVQTNYSLQKIFLYQNTLHNCPKPNNNTFCQWRDDTDPPYETMERILTFFVQGNNSLGTIENEFLLDHFEIVIPNSPEHLAAQTGKTNITIKWLPPQMTRITDQPALHYQLWLEELELPPNNKTIIDVGVDVFSYKLDDLIPFSRYKISVRCRSNYTVQENMWSPVVSVDVKTLPDVPYITPEINPEAFIIHNFGNYRNATLYWKPVSSRFFNGEDFHYHIEFSESKSFSLTSSSFIKSYTPFAKIGHLGNDSSYSFLIYSANKEGKSSEYQTIFIDERNKLAPVPKDIRAVSHELGYYNLSWSVPGDLDDYSFTVFWCSGRKPSRCDKPIQWSNPILKDNTFSLSAPDVMSNFQFAVASTYRNRSSGMQWASCIVLSKASLGQIPINHIEPSSTSLRVIWKLDCEAQKSVIDHYVITYCTQGSDCKNAVAGSDVQSYTLENLHPFTNYSVKLRAFNMENIPSEDVEPMFQITSSGDPSDSPQNVKLVSKSNSAFHVSWMPPVEPNGIITHYFIYHNEVRNRVNDGSSCKNCDFLIRNLKPFTFYNVSIEACVNLHCSPRSSPITVLTDVGVPGSMDPPRVETVNETYLKVSWTAPVNPNGPIDYYQIQWKLETGNDTINQTIAGNQNFSTFVEFKCSNLLDGGINYMFHIRAANKKNGSILYGPFSDSTKATTCLMSQGLAMIIGVAIGGTLALAFFLLVSYKLLKWMSEKIHQVKNIAVRLPKELEGPEMNPLNNYEISKNGLSQNVSNGKIEHLSYVLEENENKNRHGSGSSQFSNSSTEELIFKNGKCTKFGRKPSGDSSGCSSMSSNTTTRLHFSSECGTESDSAVPSSPDSVLNEQSVLNCYKPPMPILMEMYDPPDLLSETQPNPNETSNEKLKMYNSLVSGMVLKIDQPYSKFGISGNVTSSVPCQINPLAFYSCNLSNSEPSVFEAKCSKIPNLSSLPPYSKVGLAKSSGDILGIAKRNKEIGYSKFGFDKDCFALNMEKINPTVNIALLGNTSARENHPNTDSEKHIKHLKQLPSTQSEMPSETACNPPKVNSTSKTPSPGYVSINEVRSTKDTDISSTNSVEDDSSLETFDELQGDFPDMNLLSSPNNLCVATKDLVDLTFSNQDTFDQLLTNSKPTRDLNVGNVLPLSDVCSTESKSTAMCCNYLNEPYELNSDSLDNSQESCLDKGKNCSSNIEKSSRPSEVLLTPLTMRNGYVPFSTLSSLCDPPAFIVPNATESNVPLSIFPGDICSDIDQNYITPSNKSEMKLLQNSLVLRNKPFSPLLHCNATDSSDASKMTEISSPLKYILKPLPKVETEICEV